MFILHSSAALTTHTHKVHTPTHKQNSNTLKVGVEPEYQPTSQQTKQHELQSSGRI